jgi:hypothetical protein
MRVSVAVALWLACVASASAQEEALPAETQAVFEAVRASAVARRTEMVGSSEGKTVRRLLAVRAKRSTSDRAWAELADRGDGTYTQWISNGLMADLQHRAGSEPRAADRVLALILARQLAALWTVSPVDQAEAEAVRVFNGAGLPGGPPTEAEIVAAVDLLTESRSLEIQCRKAFLDIGPMKCRFVSPRQVRARYGTKSRQVQRYERAVEAMVSRERRSKPAARRGGLSEGLTH